ncbi:MAG: hypothetical protein ABJZ55_00220 [Fuerstiella sp.]
MKRIVRATCLALLSVSFLPSATMADGLMEAAPNDAYLAIYRKHNPERDYQKAFFAEIRQTVEDTKIVDKFFAAIQKQVPPDQFAQFEAIKNQLMQAVAPIDWDAAMDSSESLYIQTMEIPSTHHLVMARMADGGAASMVEGLTNLLKLAEAASQGQVPVVETEIGGIMMTGMGLPPGLPMNPMFGATEDGMFLFTTSPALMEQCLALMEDPSAVSKFDDPRVATAIQQLPKWEDAIVFFDGQKLFTELKGLEAFIQGVGAGNEEAIRVSELLGKVFGEIDVLDFELTVEYTDGHQNRSATYGALRDGYEGTAVGKMFVDQEKFENWSGWVPESATAWSLNSGATLAPLYAWAMEVIPATFPEAEDGLAQFQAIQDQFDIHLYDDILTGFSGESVSVAFPGPVTAFGPTAKSVTYLKCDKPDRIEALVNRGIEVLLQIPQVKQQGLSMSPVSGMDGFQQLNFPMFAMMQIQPVMGFKDGWMVLASHPDAVQTIEMTRDGEAPTIESSEKFSAFNLPIDGPIAATSYVNTGQQTRDMAKGLQSVGSMLPMIIGMAGGGGGGGPDLSKAADFLNLLPDLGRIVAKFDFLDSTLTVTKPGASAGTYMRESVTLIKEMASATH